MIKTILLVLRNEKRERFWKKYPVTFFLISSVTDYLWIFYRDIIKMLNLKRLQLLIKITVVLSSLLKVIRDTLCMFRHGSWHVRGRNAQGCAGYRRGYRSTISGFCVGNFIPLWVIGSIFSIEVSCILLCSLIIN